MRGWGSLSAVLSVPGAMDIESANEDDRPMSTGREERVEAWWGGQLGVCLHSVSMLHTTSSSCAPDEATAVLTVCWATALAAATMAINSTTALALVTAHMLIVFQQYN